MLRVVGICIAVVLGCACERANPARTRMRDRDPLCTDRAKPVAYHYAVPDAAYRAGCYDVRVHQSAKSPRSGKEEHWADVVYCCPR